MAGKVKDLLEDIARKVESNKCSAYCVGDSLTIADITIHAVFATVQAGFLAGIPTTMVEDICPSLKAVDDAVMEHPKVCFETIYAQVIGPSPAVCLTQMWKTL
nr:glutathione S-transferase [Saccharina japonica]